MVEATHTRGKNCPQETRISLLESGIEQMQKDIQEIKRDLKDFIQSADAKYVNKSEFDTIKKIVYGALTMFLGAALMFAFKTIFGW